MIKKGWVYKKDIAAGLIQEDEEGFSFQYSDTYLESPKYGPVSRTLPLRKEPFHDNNMLPFFDGLIPEGWLLEVAIENWKLNRRDRMELLLFLCRDCIGDISVIPEIETP